MNAFFHRTVAKYHLTMGLVGQRIHDASTSCFRSTS
jgi:hypothetical protein